VPGERPGDQSHAIPWRSIFQRLSQVYHWTPNEIAELTPPQWALYLADADEPSSAVAMSVSAGTDYIARRRAARDAWVDATLESHIAVKSSSPPPTPQPIDSRTAPPRDPPMANAPAPGQTPVGHDEPLSRVPATRRATSIHPAAESTRPGRKASAASRLPVERQDPRPLRRGPNMAGPDGTSEVMLSSRAVRRVDELQHVVETLVETTSETQRSVERLQRKGDTAQFG
jgi:hypothetical protein